MRRRRNGGRWRSLVLPGMLLLALVLLPSTVAADDVPELPPPDTSVYEGMLPPNQTGAVAAEPTAAELAASEDEHAGLSDAAALEVAEQEFSEVLEAQLIPELELPADQEIDKFLDPYTARISDGDWEPRPDSEQPNPNLLVEGTLPLRAPEAGEPELLDADLVADGDHFEAANPIVTAEIGAEVGEGVELPQAEVAVAPVGVAAAEAEPVADKLFYPNAATDTDYLIAPIATGAQIFAQLRSADSPESLPLEIEMPAGATLEPTDEGGAIVRAPEGEPLVSISAPVAWDAAGQEVAIDYALAGEQITMQIPHASAGEYLYPIMVDPVVDQYNWGQGQQNLDHREWWWQTTNGNDFNPVEDTSAGAGGLRTNARAGRTYAAGSYGQWLANSIRDSYIERIDFFNFDHNPTSPGTCTTLGIWMPDQFQWAPVTIQNPAGGTTTGYYTNLCGPVSHQSRHIWVGNSPTPDGPYGDAEPWDHSMGVFALNSQGGNRTAQASNLLRSAYVYRYDRNKPWMTWNNVPSGWTKDPLLFDVHDVGLGVSGVWLFGPNWTVPATGSTHCSGAHQSICPVDARVPVYPPEGKHSLTAVGMDPILNASAGFGFTSRVDRSAPQVSQPTGSLVVNKNDIRADQSYTLSVSATDGSLASPAQMRSGVKRLAIYVDDEEQPRAEWTQDCSSPDGSCAMATKTWMIPPGSFDGGQHTIRIVPTDHAGNSNGLGQVVVINAEGDGDAPQVQLQTSGVAPDGGSTLTVSASDPGPVASGVVGIEVLVEGETIATFGQVCPTGGCSMTRTVPLTAGQSAAVAEIAAIADDAALNNGVGFHGRIRRPSFVGYNDQFHGFHNHGLEHPSLDLVHQSGANMLRFAVDWCDIAGNLSGSDQADPSKGAWGGYEHFFNEVKNYNASLPPDKQLILLPILTGFPKWAQAGGNPINGNCTQPSNAGMPAWRGFVGEFLRRFAAPEYNVEAVEAWNEPNLRKFWDGGTNQDNFDPEPQMFARLFNVVRTEVDAVNPSRGGDPILVAPGGLSSDGVTTNRSDARSYMLDATDPQNATRIAAPDVDFISVHLYADKAKSDREARERLKGKWETMVAGLRDNFAGKNRWITEIGFPTTALSGKQHPNPKTQANRLKAAWARYRRADGGLVKAFLVHRLFDGKIGDEAQNYGLVNHRLPNPPPAGNPPAFDPRPAYCFLAQRLGPGSVVGC